MPISRRVLLCAVLFLAGCGSQPLRAKVDRVGNPMGVSVAVEVRPNFTSPVTEVEYQQALEAAILESGVFTSIDPLAKTKLTVLLSFAEPVSAGFTMTGRFPTVWVLEHGGQVEATSIASNVSKGAGDAFIGATRKALAERASVEESIPKGLEWVLGTSIANAIRKGTK